MHASKGLQAPIVYLPDTTRVPSDLRPAAGRRERQRGCGCRAAGDANEAARAWRGEARDRSLEEQNRLLYVAMTRAEDRLYVGGWIGSKPQDSGCWYDRIGAGLAASVDGESVEPRVQATAQDLRLHEATSARPAGPATASSWSTQAASWSPSSRRCRSKPTARLEAWARKPAPAEPDPPTPLAPSQPLPDEAARAPRAFSPLAAGRPRRWQRGQLLHELLRHLPALPAAERDAAARRFLAQPAHGLERGGDRGMGRRGAGRHRGARLTATCSPRARAPRCR